MVAVMMTVGSHLLAPASMMATMVMIGMTTLARSKATLSVVVMSSILVMRIVTVMMFIPTMVMVVLRFISVVQDLAKEAASRLCHLAVREGHQACQGKDQELGSLHS